MAKYPEEESSSGEEIDPEALKSAIDKTKNGEEIFVNDEDRIDSRPITDLTDAEFDELVRRLKDVVALMQNLSTRTDAYNRLSFRLDGFRLLLNRRNKSSVDVHDISHRTIRFVKRSHELDDLPQNDPNLDDFLSVLEDTGSELSQRDASVRERMWLLTNARFDQFTKEQKAELETQTDVLAHVSTDELAEDQRQDIEIASDDSADPEDRKEARYRWTSRFVRAYEQAQKHAGRLGLTPERVNAITAAAERVIRWLLGSGGG